MRVALTALRATDAIEIKGSCAVQGNASHAPRGIGWLAPHRDVDRIFFPAYRRLCRRREGQQWNTYRLRHSQELACWSWQSGRFDEFWHVHHQGWRVVVLYVFASGGVMFGKFLKGDAAEWKPVIMAIITVWMFGLNIDSSLASVPSVVRGRDRRTRTPDGTAHRNGRCYEGGGAAPRRRDSDEIRRLPTTAERKTNVE